jgi:hypothetical protein
MICSRSCFFIFGAESTGHQYLGTVEEENVLKYYLRKASSEEEKLEKDKNKGSRFGYLLIYKRVLLSIYASKAG